MASNPEALRYTGKHPPAVDSPQIPVKGDLAKIPYLVDPGSDVPSQGPVARTILFEGPSGSIPGSSSLNRIHAARPRPPKNSLAIRSFNGSYFKLDLVKLTLRILPMYPCTKFRPASVCRKPTSSNNGFAEDGYIKP